MDRSSQRRVCSTDWASGLRSQPRLSLAPAGQQTVQLASIGRPLREWASILVSSEGRVVSAPNRSIDPPSNRPTQLWLLSGAASRTSLSTALAYLDSWSTQPLLSTVLSQVQLSRQGGSVYLARRSLIRCLNSSSTFPGFVGATYGQDAGRVDSAPSRILSLAQCPWITLVVVPDGQVLIVGRVVSTPSRCEGSHTSTVEHYRCTQADAYAGGSSMYSPMQGHAILSQYSTLRQTTGRDRGATKPGRRPSRHYSVLAGPEDPRCFHSCWLLLSADGGMGSKPHHSEVTTTFNSENLCKTQRSQYIANQAVIR